MNKQRIKKLNEKELSYLSGFLEGDGCILVQIVKGSQYKFGHTIRFSIVFFQKKEKKWFFLKLKKMIGVGSIRIRNDNMMEFCILGKNLVEKFLTHLLPYLILKRTLAILTLKILKQVQREQTEANFLEACRLVDKVAELTFSKNRKNTLLSVQNSLKLPVETEK